MMSILSLMAGFILSAEPAHSIEESSAPARQLRLEGAMIEGRSFIPEEFPLGERVERPRRSLLEEQLNFSMRELNSIGN